MRAFLWQFENSIQENEFVNATPPGVAGGECVSSSSPKAKHWPLSVTRWMRHKIGHGWVNR
ncbi:TPA: hypothetical protein I4G64_06045 [Enterobacter cloacae]|nr:hypothetical protein [Enterobacter pasteurii]